MRCPYCHSPMDSPVLPDMSKRKKRIYDAVVVAGPGGIIPDDLQAIMNQGGGKGGNIVLRVHINELNGKLKPYKQKIKGHRSLGYRLIEI